MDHDSIQWYFPTPKEEQRQFWVKEMLCDSSAIRGLREEKDNLAGQDESEACVVNSIYCLVPYNVSRTLKDAIELGNSTRRQKYSRRDHGVLKQSARKKRG